MRQVFVTVIMIGRKVEYVVVSVTLQSDGNVERFLEAASRLSGPMQYRRDPNQRSILAFLD